MVLLNHHSMYDHAAMQNLSARETGVAQLPVHVYPPTFPVLFAPFILIKNLKISRMLFLLFTQLCFFGSMGALTAFARRTLLPAHKDIQHPSVQKLIYLSGIFTLIMASVYWPMICHHWEGQLNLVIMLLAILMATYLLREKQQPVLASLFLCLAISLKLFPAIFLPSLLIMGAYYAFGMTLGWTVILVLLSLFWIPVSQYLAFPEILLNSTYLSTSEYTLFSHSATSAVGNLLENLGIRRSLHTVPITMVRFGPCLLWLILFFRTCRRPLVDRNRNHLIQMIRFSQAFILTGFIMTRWWEHHLVFLIWPFFLLFAVSVTGLPQTRVTKGMAILSFLICAWPFIPIIDVEPFTFISLTKVFIFNLKVGGIANGQFVGPVKYIASFKFWGTLLLLITTEMSIFTLRKTD